MRIRNPDFGNLDPHPHQIKIQSASNKNPDLYPDPHQSDKLDLELDPHQFSDGKPKCMEYEPI
jgi:hypothetical protein